MVQNDRTKKLGYMQRNMVTEILASRVGGGGDGDAGNDGDAGDETNMTVVSSEDDLSEVGTSNGQKKRVGKAKRNTELLAQNEKVFQMIQEKAQGKEEIRQKISKTLDSLVDNRPMSIAVCGKQKVLDYIKRM